MRPFSRLGKLLVLGFIFLFSTILVYAASPLSNPLCNVEQISNLPAGGYYMSGISGDGSRAVAGSSPEGSTTHIWDLETNTLVDTLTDAAYPVLDYDGSRIAFYSNANLAGQNADGSYEVYLWDEGTISQITNLSGSVIISPPDISDNGTSIAFGINPLGGSAGEASTYNYLYLWREGPGLEPLTGPTGAATISAIRISANGNELVFNHTGDLTDDDPLGEGAFYRYNIFTEVTTHLVNAPSTESPIDYFVINSYGTRLAFNSTENINNLNPDNESSIYVWDSSTGLQILSNGTGTPLLPYTLPLGFANSGYRLLFASGYNPTGENPDGSVEYFIFDYPGTIRQISSKTGLPYVFPANEAISFNGAKTALILPTGTDYAVDNPAYLTDIELFNCNSHSLLPAPDNLRSTSLGQTSITLAWDDNASNESSYKLERSTNGGSSWTEIASPSANITSYTDNTLSCNTNYQYRVRAYRSSDTRYSDYSNTLSVSSSSCITLAVPSNLRKSAGTRTSISLAWNDNTNQNTAYSLERSDNSGSTWTELVSLGANATSYTNTGLLCNTSYQYRIRAYHSGETVYSGYSNTLITSTSACPPVATPSNLRRQTLSQTSVLLAWNDNATDETTYSVERSSDAGVSWTEIANPGANTTGYADNTLSCSTSYRYRVRAYRGTNATWSSYSNALSITTNHCDFNAPDNLRTSSVGLNSISLAWDDNSSVENNYRIERSLNGGTTWTQIATVAANVTSYTNNNLSCNTNYHYRVRAYRSADASFTAYSTLAVTTALCPPLAPGNLRSIVVTANSITIAWADNSSDETSFAIARRIGTGDWVAQGNVSATTTTFTNTGLTCNTSYGFVVQAIRNSGTEQSSPLSNIITVKTGPCINKPLNIGGGYIGSDVVLTWLDNSAEESSYRVERSINGGAWTEIAQLAPNTTAYTDISRTCFENPRYRIRSHRLSNATYSPYSDIVVPHCNQPTAPSTLAMNIVGNFPVLTWTDNTTTETHYSVEISSDAGLNWSNQTLIFRSVTSFTHEFPDCDKIYSYRVRAFDYYTNSYSNPSSIVQWQSPTCLRPVNGAVLVVTRTASNDARITVNRPSPVADYLIQATIDNGQTWFTVTTLDGQAITPYLHTVRCGFVHRFRMVETFASGQYDYSPEVNFTQKPCQLSRPTGFYHVPSGVIAGITWNRNPESGAVLHTLERRILGTTNWETVYTVYVGTSPSHTYIAELDCDIIYDYRVTASKGTQVSAPTANLRIAAPTCASFPAPTNLAFSDLGDGQVELTWTDNSNHETDFIILIPNQVEYTIPANSTSYVLTPPSCGVPYDYVLRAYDSGSASHSMRIMGTFSVTCASLASASLNISSETESSVRLEWNDVLATEGEYVIYQVSSDGEIAQYNLDDTSTSLVIDELVCGENYDFQLRARREADNSSTLSNAVDFSFTACAPSNTVSLYNNGTWSFADSATSALTGNLTLGDASWQAFVGDWDGDGSDGIGLYRNGEFVLRSLVNGSLQESHFSFGESGTWQAVSGDWNGDGIDTVGLYGNGEFILSDDNATIHYRFNLGDASWQAVSGDWDGNGADGLALYKEGIWLLVDSALNPASQTISYGPAQAGWLPVAGDWDNDGIDTIGLYNNGLWRLRLTSNREGSEISIVFGTAGDVPLGRYTGNLPGIDYAAELPLALTPVPSAEPTVEPSLEPTLEPTTEPTTESTLEPTTEPTVEPSLEPTVEPTVEPTTEAPVSTPEAQLELSPEATQEG